MKSWVWKSGTAPNGPQGCRDTDTVTDTYNHR